MLSSPLTRSKPESPSKLAPPRRQRRAAPSGRFDGQTYSQAKATILSEVSSAVLSLLDQGSDQELDVQAPLMEMGLDSLAATQLVRQLSTDLGVQLSPTLLFDYPTVDTLSAHLASELAPEDPIEVVKTTRRVNGRPKSVSTKHIHADVRSKVIATVMSLLGQQNRAGARH